ncbi:HAMP domain-containing sensor histidine kinase [Ramlibacter sp.]|uniref:sensor histidine kinase n=1 Tax=Ramlibacter sp. TaxID=1917967 RepID=UPI0017B4F84A|nr:HAMP domain-containing sensor histidine kinase [Ramlibacter sp.]MBA2676155.1 HAMP domain-containing histidine kinase [Ramlibacter sp.]
MSPAAANLSEFIVIHAEKIMREWETFAATMQPAAADMSSAELRDHAKQMLDAISVDMDKSRTAAQQTAKSKGLVPAASGTSAAEAHGAMRHASGFSLEQLFAEFRAVRHSVLQLWLSQAAALPADNADEIIRFNGALDLALAESVATFAYHSNRTKDTFLAILGHDLRGPLATMSVAGGYLSRPGVGTEATLRMGARVSRSAATMTAMVNDLLEFSRSQLGGKIPLAPELANLAEICEAAAHDAGAVYPDAIIEVEVSGDVTGIFDSDRLQQVLTNLLVNAAQYSAGQVPVVIAAEGTPDTLVVKVTNHGPVIPQAHLKTIFDPLIQLPQDSPLRKRLSTSLGLGLFIAEQIVFAHAGSIKVESSASKGTVFSIEIPRLQAAPDEAAPGG